MLLRWIIVEAAHSRKAGNIPLAERKGRQITIVTTVRKLLLPCYSICKE